MVEMRGAGTTGLFLRSVWPCWVGVIVGVAAVLATGCAGDARVELAAAQSLEALAAAMNQSVREYHEEIAVSDDEREAAIVSAYLTRVRADAGNPESLASHERDLVAALDKLRADRDVEAARFSATVDNVALLRETATQLRHSAIKTAAMSKATRDYFESLAHAISDRSDAADAGSSRQRSAN